VKEKSPKTGKRELTPRLLKIDVSWAAFRITAKVAEKKIKAVLFLASHHGTHWNLENGTNTRPSLLINVFLCAASTAKLLTKPTT